MEAVAKHDFNATADDELSFRKNQILKVSMAMRRLFRMNSNDSPALNRSEVFELIAHTHDDQRLSDYHYIFPLFRNARRQLARH